MLVWIRAPEPVHTPPEERHGLRHEVTAGLRLVVNSPILRAIGVQKVADGLGGGIFTALILLYGIETLGFEPGVLGTIFAIGGITSILGALSAGPLTRRFGLGGTLTIGLLLWALSASLIPLARGPLVLADALLGAQQLFDCGRAIYEINEVSLRQSMVSPRMLGQVNASMEVAELSSQLVGSLLAGALAEAVGIRWALVAGSFMGAAGGLRLLLSPVRDVRSALPQASIDAEPEPWRYCLSPSRPVARLPPGSSLARGLQPPRYIPTLSGGHLRLVQPPMVESCRLGP